MQTIFLNSLGILLILLLAIGTKRVGLLHQSDSAITSKLVVYVTLPAMIVVGVNHTRLSGIFFILMGMGVATNLILVGVGYLLGRRSGTVVRGFYMFELSGYNIGNFSIPFVSSFFPAAIPFLAMFDMGNSIMCTGGTQAIVETTADRNQHGFILRDILNLLFRNPPFVTYILMFAMAVFGLSFPNAWLTAIKPLASANTLLSIFTIGLFMEFRLPKGKLGLIFRVLFSRYLMAAIFSVIVLVFLPFPHLVKEVLLLIFFCPMSFLQMLQATEFGNDRGTTGLAISLSMLVSLILMSAVVILF